MKRLSPLSLMIFFLLAFMCRHAGTAAANTPEIPGNLLIVGMQDCCPEEAWSEVEAHLAREFRILGFSVRTVPGRAMDEGERRKELQTLSDSENAACAIRVVRPPEGSGTVELWLNDRVTRKILFRSMEIHSNQGEPQADVTALRVVELFRASLLELGMAGRPKPKLAPVVAKLAPAPVDESSRLNLETALGIFVTRGGLPVLGLTVIGARVRLADSLFISADFGLSHFERTIELADSSSSVDLTTLNIWGGIQAFSHLSTHLSLHAGAGMQFFATHGLKAGLSHISREDHTRVGTFAIRSDFGWQFHNRLEFTLSTRLGMSFPEVSIRFGTEEVARSGRPYLEILFGLRVGLW